MAGNSNSLESNSFPKLEHYAITEKLGSGSFAIVYKAYKRNDSKMIVAIKCVRKDSLSKTARENLISEIRILKNADHENIVKLIDFYGDENYIHIIMEYCSGGSLWNFIQKHHRLPEKICQRFLQQLVAAMKYLRKNNISHFDLKPQNILIKSRRLQSLKVADFGLAQPMSVNETISLVKGSPLYMAPEIALKKEYDARADIWSVGVILYECLFGKAPYSSNTIEELLLKIKNGKDIEVPPGANVSANCKDFLERCLKRDLEKRWKFEDFFNHPFVDLEHAPTSTSMEKTANHLREAVKNDEKLEYQAAFDSYNEAMKYMVPILNTEVDSIKRGHIRRKMAEYVKRMEIIKTKHLSASNAAMSEQDMITICTQLMQPKPNRTIRITGENDLSELYQLAKPTPSIGTALDILQSAELYAREGKFSLALEKYEMAFGKLMKLLANEPKGRRKDLLLEAMDSWMNQAERLKQLENGLNTSYEVEIEKNCVLQ